MVRGGGALAAGFFSFIGPAAADPPDLTPVEDALTTIGLDTSDTRLPIDSFWDDPFRLAVVDSVLETPLLLPAVCDRWAARSDDPSTAASRLLDWTLAALDDRSGPGTASAEGHVDVSERLVLAAAMEEAGAPAGEVRTVTELFEACVVASTRHREVDAGLLRGAHESVATFEETEEELDPFRLRESERESIAASDRFFAAAERVPVAGLLAEHVPLVTTLESLVFALAADTVSRTDWIPFRWESEHGTLVVGSPGDDEHSVDAFLLIDPGGSDRYPRGAGGTGIGDRRLQVTVDLAGNDVYMASGSGSLAAGVGGIGVLVDVAGDDTYRGAIADLGVGVFGVGILLDLDGSDIYDGIQFGQGAGFFGLGMLLDAGGSDVYRLGANGQGFGGVGGVGLLRDYEGGDRYLSAPRFTDVIRYEDHHLSFLQGAANGDRPFRSGGIGLLVDDSGNDLYESDIFGQGVAYWFGIGALLDRSGHDVYAGYQYSQGSGVHLAAGLLVDDAGNDVYRARGVSQGCGHDLAIGLLADRAGNDTYVSVDLSQGAGNANGIGVLLDTRGRDAYVVDDQSNTLGYGNPRRGSGSIGLLVDRAGEDVYAQGGQNDRVWWGSRVGAGLDYPEEITETDAWPPPPADPVVEMAYTTEELFVLASMGPPRFREWKAAAVSRLAEEGGAVMPTLVRYLDSPIPRERWGLKDIFETMGETCVPFLAAVLDTGSVRERRVATWCLGYVGSPLALDPLTRLFTHGESELRATAVMAVARVVRADSTTAATLDTAPLQTLLDDPSSSVRSAALFAIGSTGREDQIPVLVRGLDDDFFSVRVTAAVALQKLGALAVDPLLVRADTPGLGRCWGLSAIEKIEDPRVGPALALRSPDARAWPVRERLAFVRALHAHRADTDALSALSLFEQDPDWRVAAIARRRAE